MAQRMNIKDLKKGEELIAPDVICNKIYFLLSGSIKSFYTKDEKDHTTWIYLENEMFTSWHSYSLQVTSIECFKANEPSRVAVLNRADVEYVKDKYIDFLHFLNTYYELSMGFFDYITKKFPTSSAADNYAFILAKYPKLVARASNSDIASIIGVSRETISRIRSQRTIL